MHKAQQEQISLSLEVNLKNKNSYLIVVLWLDWILLLCLVGADSLRYEDAGIEDVGHAGKDREKE